MCELSIVIVNYNVREYLEKLLSSIYDATNGIGKEIFVVDNNSSDESVEKIKEKFSDLILFENKENIGFSKANNVALKKCSGKYILLINPDTIIKNDTLRKMINFFNNYPDCGAAGCKVLNPDSSLQLACRRGFPSPFTSFSKISGLSKIFPKSKLFGKYNLTYLDSNKINVVDAISGSFMMVRKEILEEVGYLDEDFFLYGEDIDWCYRITKKGWKVYYYPEAEIIHFKGRSSQRSNIDTEKEFYRSMILFVEKHFNSRYVLWFLKIGIWVIRWLTYFKRKLKIFAVKLINSLFLNFKLFKINKRKLVIGSFADNIKINGTFKNKGARDNSIVGVFNLTNMTFKNENKNEKLENETNLRKIIKDYKVNEIIFSSICITHKDILKVMEVCRGLKIRYELISQN